MSWMSSRKLKKEEQTMPEHYEMQDEETSVVSYDINKILDMYSM